jgi:hypothetical protein
MCNSNKKLSRAEAGFLGYLKVKEKHKARRKAARDSYMASPKICALCNIALPYEKKRDKFCSRSCAVTHNNTGVNRYIGKEKCATTQKPQVEKVCKLKNTCRNCGKAAKRIFCCISCLSAHRWSEQKKKIEIAGVFNHVRSKNYTKKYLIEANGHACMICKTAVWCDQPVPLILDHIDGDSANNKVDNIRLVCGNCDMQLPTYKNKNKGKGRASRRERYRLKNTY